MFWLFSLKACWILAPQAYIELAPLALEGEVLNTGLLGKSPKYHFYMPWETRKSWDFLYCSIQYTVMVWNPTHNTSEVCLYPQKLPNHWLRTTGLKPYYLLIVCEVKVAQSCLTLCNPMDCIVPGILQARILEWVAFAFSTGSSQPRDQTWPPTLQVDSLPAEPQEKPLS